MWAMTTPIRRPSSKPWNTGRSFQNGSGVPRTAGHSARTFSAGTILSITIPESDSSRRKMSITDGLNKLSNNVRPFWMMLLQNIRSGLRGKCQNQRPCQRQPGSINRYQKIVIHYDTKFLMEVSHFHWQVPQVDLGDWGTCNNEQAWKLYWLSWQVDIPLYKILYRLRYLPTPKTPMF